MTKKSILSNNTFDWIKSTFPNGLDSIVDDISVNEIKQENYQNSPFTEVSLNNNKKINQKKMILKRIAFVQYNKKTGAIIAMAEAIEKGVELITQPFLNVSKTDKVDKFVISRELLGKSLIEIHKSYKVKTSEKKKAPTLIKKKT